MQFDLISDLHIDFWPAEYQVNWQGIPTSLVAVIAGDVSRNPEITYSTVLEISKHYKHVLFVDGNHEHNDRGNINIRREEIAELFSKYRNITYLYRNTTVLDGVAFIGCNGWWSYDFCEPYVGKSDCIQYMTDVIGKDPDVLMEQWHMAIEDAEFLGSAVKICSEDPTVKKIVLVTHTIPNRHFAWHPPGPDVATMGLQGSSYLPAVLDSDVNSKIKVWCFGHLHQKHDENIFGVRYISNPRGVPTNLGSQKIYYPYYVKC
jgi:predicted phosphohydrolase